MLGTQPAAKGYLWSRRALAGTLSAVAVIVAAAPQPALAQGGAVLEEIFVTAQRREENLQEVPISVSTMSSERFDAIFEGGEDIRALAARVPSLYAESSNGRLAPRFYIRGLGNTDFDLAASQSVSIIFDEVVQENVILKSFPLFDIAQVEVLRGPQGTLFGRNTPAGIIKFDTKKPTQEFDASVGATYGSEETIIVDGAIGGGLIEDQLSARASFLYQDRSDWIDNDFTGEGDAMGGFEELAWRGQLLYEPTGTFSALLNMHGRDLSNGTASIFRANILGPGDNDLNNNFDRDTVSFDEGDDNPQKANALGGSLKLDYDFTDEITLTSITGYEQVDNKSLGDIDGGFGADFLPFVGPCPPGTGPGDTCIPFPSQTQDGIDNLDQRTQEVRLAVQASDRLFWQAGAFYFDSEFAVTTVPFFVPPTTVTHENTAWAVFGQASYDFTDAFNLTGGLRYTDDEKKFKAYNAPIPTPNEQVSDEKFSGDLSALYTINDQVNVYGRAAYGFRGPTIQGRDVAFFGAPSAAKSETIFSVETGAKTDLASGRVRLNGSVYYYTINDQQFSAIGGVGNLVQLVNADEGTGWGVDVDGEFLVTDSIMLTAGASYNDTEIKDNDLRVAPCGSGLCTVKDPLDANGNAIVDGNSFPQAPEWLLSFTARYTVPLGPGEFFAYTEWFYQGDTEFFLYESEEFNSDGTFEGGLRLGYQFGDGKYEVAAFARNITDEENVKGAIDFNNLTGFVNEPRIVGVSFRANFAR